MAADDHDLIDILAAMGGEKPAGSVHEQRRREKGLPDEATLREMASVYLKLQHKLWPQLIKLGVLAKQTDANVARMAESFKRRFLLVEPGSFARATDLPPGTTVGAGYLRYSDPGSNPLSLAQQLTNVLVRAHREGCFIPWEYVFADAAVTGTIAARTGYQMAKSLIRRDDDPIAVFFIDELGRASRDHIESLLLGRLIEACGKRMVGATDGFDSATPYSKLMLTIFGMLHEIFIDQLRAKVKRGMRDAFERGKNIHPPAVGYKLVPVLKENGDPLLDDDGRPVTERVIDTATAEILVEGATRFADHGWSRGRVARLFNEKKVGGIETWDNTRVRQLLKRPTYRGYEFNEVTYQVKDPTTGGVTVKTRPEAEWKRREVPHLRIFSDDLAARIDARLAETKAAYDAKERTADAPSRTEVYPTRLVRPVCGVCRQPLGLGRSGKYASYTCLNGKEGKQGCTFKGYKSVRIVEDSVLRAVKARVFTDAFVQTVVGQANQYLAAGPTPADDSEAGAVEPEVRRRKEAIKRLTAKLSNVDGADDETAMFRQIAALRREIKEFQGQAPRRARKQAGKVPPVTAESVKTLLDDLRGVLDGDVAVAAPVLAALTGPVVVTQEKIDGADEPEWVARFSVDLARVMAVLGRKRGCPTTGIWEFLNTHSWTIGQTVEARVRPIPRHEELAPQAASMAAAGSSIESIAHVFGVDWQTAKRAVEYGKTHPATPAESAIPLRRKKVPKAHPRAAEIVQLRDAQEWSFVRIARKLKISTATATRAYDRCKTAELREAAETGATPSRGRFRHLNPAVVAQIESLLREGQKPSEIARIVGCGISTVYRERARLELGGPR